MKFIICGAGKVGLTIAQQLLLNTENDVTIVDFDEERISNAKNLDLKTIYGFSSSPETLDMAGAIYADTIICVTLSDEINMLTAHIAGTMFNVKTKIARIRSTMYLSDKWSSHIYRQGVLGIDYIVSPEIEIAKHVMDMLYHVGVECRIPFYRQNYNLISILIKSQYNQYTITELQNKIDLYGLEECDIKFVKRDNELHFVSDDFSLGTGDEVYFLCKNKDVQQVVKVLYGSVLKLQNVLVCGGGDVGLNIAQHLESKHFNVKLIEKNQERSDFLANNLSYNTVVMCGDMHDKNLLEECGSMDAIISVSGHDEVNLFTTLIAQSIGIPKCFTLIDERNYSDVFANLNLQNIINTRDITISKILNCIGGQYFTMQEVVCGGVYIICEFIINKNASINGLEYHKVETMEMYILGMVRGGEVINNEFTEGKFIDGDVILAILPFKNIHKLEKLLKH
ncbi:MAG: trk system potassium uptake protein TrkA [Candidatus Deianiraeaceae bacterium]|jgi:trk system potassium uptake protein TrkA